MYQQALIWGSFVGVALVATATLVLAARFRSMWMLVSAIGFVLLLSANVAMNYAPHQITYQHTKNGELSGAQIQYGMAFSISRIGSSAGVLIGGVGLLGFALREK